VDNSQNVLIQGNQITSSNANGVGIGLEMGATNVLIDTNTISGQTQAGVVIGAGVTGNVLTANKFFGNGTGVSPNPAPGNLINADNVFFNDTVAPSPAKVVKREERRAQTQKFIAKCSKVKLEKSSK